MKEWQNFWHTGKQIKMENKKLGWITSDLVFISPRIEKRHKFRLYDGYAMNELLLRDLLQKGIKRIELRVKCEDGMKILKTTPHFWLINGIKYQHHDYEPQIILPEKLFEVKKW